MRWLLWLLVAAFAAAFAAACAHSAGPAEPPRPPPAGAPEAASPPHPDDRECDELITHAVVLGIDERSESLGGGDPAGSAGGPGGRAPRGIDERAARPGAPRTTAADHEAVRRSLHRDFLAGCRALPRDAYRCAMAATTLAALAACQPAQRTPSSSTSNSSVAPGGITPPAPRSP